jgi:hypothetical protein
MAVDSARRVVETRSGDVLAPGGSLAVLNEDGPVPAGAGAPRTDSGDETKTDLYSLAGVEQLVSRFDPVCGLRRRRRSASRRNQAWPSSRTDVGRQAPTVLCRFETANQRFRSKNTSRKKARLARTHVTLRTRLTSSSSIPGLTSQLVVWSVLVASRTAHQPSG